MRISDCSSDVCSSDLLPGTIMRDKGGNVVKLSIRRADPASCYEIKVQDKARHGDHRGRTVFRRYLSLKQAVDCYRSDRDANGKNGEEQACDFLACSEHILHQGRKDDDEDRSYHPEEAYGANRQK